MDQRTRVLTAFAHRNPDRVPLDFGGHRSSGIAVQAYQKLRDYLGLKKSRLYIYDVLQQLAIVEDDMLDLFEADVCQLGYSFYKDEAYWQPWKLHDGTECMIPRHIAVKTDADGNYYIDGNTERICIQKTDCFYFEQTVFPLENSDAQDYGNLEHVLGDDMWVVSSTPPAPYSLKRREQNYLGDIASKQRESTRRAILGIFGGSLLETAQHCFKTDHLYVDMAINADKIERFLDALLDLHMKNLEGYLDAVGSNIDIIGFSDDLGMQTGPQFSVDMFVRFFQPRYQKMWSYIKKRNPDMKIILHSCGGIEPFLSHLIDAGLDAVNPVQTTCAGMKPEHLKERYGNDIVFWGGGCDTRDILPNGTPAQIRENVKENIEIFSKNGGFVFQQVHNILANVPPRNVVAMFEAVKEFR